MKVLNYQTGETLRGRPTKELREASEAASSGAVPAYRDRFNWWQYVRPAEVEFSRRTLGLDVQTVFIEP